jgi:transposase
MPLKAEVKSPYGICRNSLCGLMASPSACFKLPNWSLDTNGLPVRLALTTDEAILPRCNRSEPICFSPYLYRARNLVERFFKKIKQCRRVATRYDKLATNYLAFIQLASIRLWLRVNESTP